MSDNLSSQSQTGFAHILLLVLAILAIGVIATSVTPNTSNVLGEENQSQTNNQDRAQNNNPEQEQKDAVQAQNQLRTNERVMEQARDDTNSTASAEEIKLRQQLQTQTRQMEQTMHQEFERAGVTIASASGAPLFVKNRIAATTHFPLTVDTATNQLIVTTPAGTKTVAILPDQAVQNMIRNGIVNLINSSNLPPISSDSAEISSDSAQISDVVNLELQNNQLVYRINGIKIHKLLGLVPITTNKTVYVSAETGQLLSQQQSVIANILDFLSR